jgi:hypothetical protein
MVTGQAGHDLEQLDEVLALHRLDLGQRGAAALLVVGQDHLADGDDAVALEEHVLGAAQADALAPNLRAWAASAGVSALVRMPEGADLVGPLPSARRSRPTARAARSARRRG